MKTHFRRALTLALIIAAALIAPARSSGAGTLPHYFPEGLETTTNPVAQWALIFETIKATALCQTAPVGASPVFNARTIKEVHVIKGKKVTFHFDTYTRQADGKIYYTDYCGRKEITEAQFDVARKDWLRYYADGAEGTYEYHKNVEPDIVSAIALSEKKTEAEIRAELDKPVPELVHLSPPVTFREFLGIPAAPTSVSDFVQTEVHIVHAQYFGMVLIDTELVYLTPQGRMLDYLHGKPSVAVHELTHGNQKLQSLMDGLDKEYLASLPMILIPEDKFWFVFHPYVKDMREIAEVLFGFNFTQARKEIFGFEYDGINRQLSEAKLVEYTAQIDRIKAVLSQHYREVALPEIYRHRLFWASLNNKLLDDRAVFRILAVKDFDLTGLGGHAKTMEWLQTHEPEIKEMFDKAFKESGKRDSLASLSSGNQKPRDMSSLRLFMNMTGLSEERIRELAKKHNLDLAKLAAMSEEEALDVILPILRAERNARYPTLKENVQ